jgi:outer membrane protein
MLPLLFNFTEANAQQPKKWSLKDCIEYAKENNLTIKKQSLNTEYRQNIYNQKKLDRIPTINGNVGYQLSFGRVPDETTYQYVDQTTQFGRFSVSSSVPLFQGFSLQNQINRDKANWQAARQDLEAAKNDLALNITSLYLQVLFDKELLEVAKGQQEVAKEQVENTQKLVEAGRVAEGNLLEIKSQAAREALTVTQMQNNLTMSLLSLAQALDLEETGGFDIVIPEIPELQEGTLAAPGALFNQAVEIMPQTIWRATVMPSKLPKDSCILPSAWKPDGVPMSQKLKAQSILILEIASATTPHNI